MPNKRDSMAAIADLLAATSGGQASKLRKPTILDNPKADKLFQIACVLSLVTVCLHTPRTLQLIPILTFPILICDSFVTIVFTVEAVIKAKHFGLIWHKSSYLRHRWSQFDLLLLIVHWISLLLYVYQIISIFLPSLNLIYYEWLGVIRSMRPFIIIRLLRLLLKFELPKARIQQLLKRMSQQVQNVTWFFVFFMVLYAIMGIQFFGRMDYHCVIPGTNPENVTINDLMIPDTMCSKKGDGGYECPDNMECMKLDLSAKAEGFYGMFDDFGHSIFTVYLAASEEGWVYVLYDCIDSLPSHLAFMYFVTLIFFLAWLVKNVFIAVITETFAEIRVQFSEMWQKNEVTLEDDFKQRIERTEDGWRLIKLDTDPKHFSPRIKTLQNILRSTTFQCIIVGLVLANALINGSFVYKHNSTDSQRRQLYYYIECGFTLLFNIESAVKIICYGFKTYWKRNIFKFELLLCVGSTLNTIKYFYERNVFTYFQCFRLFRLIKASPMLEDFVYKIFSPGKKLGGLVIFTVLTVIIASAMSLQLFCYVPNLPYFQTFPQAFMAMFQIVTQEGWTDFVVDVLRLVDDKIVAIVAIYFVSYHLFVTLIVLSLFVAVILDNLEMDEELKKVKQLKAKEAITSMRTNLPWRLRIFERFPTRPQMVNLKRVDSDFLAPKIRDSFTTAFVNECEDVTVDPAELGNQKTILRSVEPLLRKREFQIRARHVGQLTMKANVNALIRISLNQPSLAMQPSIRGKPMSFYETMTENGDLGRISDPARKELKQGEIDVRALQQKQQMAEMARTRIEKDMRENHPYFDRPLFAVGRDSSLRRFCQKLASARYNGDKSNGSKTVNRQYKQFFDLIGLMPYIDWAMVLITLLSCISMLFESPFPTTGENLVMFNVYLQIADYLFVLSMTIELAVKTIAHGLVFTPEALVRDFGGVMTLFVYATSLIFLLLMPKHVEINSFAQILMICRAIRPLRIYTLVPHIRRVVIELFRGFKEILLVTILMVVVMFIFATFGVQTVGGKLGACNDQTIKSRENCTGVFWQKIFVTRLEVIGKDEEHPHYATTGFTTAHHDDHFHPKLLVPRVWMNPHNFDFDHVGNAMLALFETLSYKGWNVIRDILWRREGPWAATFIHIYVFIGCMIGITLFVGVVVANYTENRGTALLTVDQRRWRDLKARLKMAQPLHVPPKPSESAYLRRRFYEWAMSKTFNSIFAFAIVLNCATLFLPWSVDEEDELPMMLYAATTISAIIHISFAIEIMFKIVAFTLSGFWQSRRNRIDLLITALGIIWIVTHFFIALPASVVGGETRLKKFTYTFGYLVVIMRFFTIAGRSTTLKMLMLTVVMSMFRSFFIIIAMALVVLFYAYTGVILFGMAKYSQAVSKHVNFRTASEALVVLFRSVTGEDWNDIMHSVGTDPPFCYWHEGMNYWETDCGNYYGAIIYFCSFYLIISYIVRNLLVAIIMENFSLFYSSEEDALLSYADIRNFQLVWNIVDIEQKGIIPVRRVKFLLRLLKGRLEVDPNKDRLLFKHMCYEMERLHNGDDVSFHDVLYMLSYRSVDIRKSLQLEELLQREELEYIIEEEVAKQTIKTWLEYCLRKIRAPHKDSIVAQMIRPNFGNVHVNPSVNPTDFGSQRPKLSVIPLSMDAGDGTDEHKESSNVITRKLTEVYRSPRSPVDEDIPEYRKRKRAIRGRRKSIPDVIELSAHDLPDLEEWSEDNPNKSQVSPILTLPPKSPISPQNAQMDSLQPLRKISIVSPVNSHPIHASAHSGIDVFFAGSGPTGTGAPNQNSTFFEIIGSENAKGAKVHQTLFDVVVSEEEVEKVISEDFRQFLFVRSAFRVSDNEIRLSIVKSHNNSNPVFFNFGGKSGQVSLECHLETCPDTFSPPCDMNGYIGFIKNLTIDDDVEYLSLSSISNFTAEIEITDVRINSMLPQHKLGVCVQPIYLMTDYALFIQFFEYWLSEGATKFYLYWESFAPEVQKILDFYKETSDADIELVNWSRLPSEGSEESNPNAFWFRLEVFLAIFDCMHRARHQIKFVAQTDLDEMFHVANGSLIDFLESVDNSNPDIVAMQFLSRKVHLESFNDFEISNPGDFSFKVYEKFAIDRRPYKKPFYTKMIHRPERDLHVHIHRPSVAELIPGRYPERYKYVDISQKQATVWHFRRLHDYYKSPGVIMFDEWANKSMLWEDAFIKRLEKTNLDLRSPWKNYNQTLGLKLEKCRQKQNDNRRNACHNLFSCEESIAEMKTVDWIRAENCWHVI
uniref:Ion transport domain-containing protein n=1 Tax=Panagrolaimus sp. JU765 TaxID=591449 RepID=A0AC34QHG3_9BILA